MCSGFFFVYRGLPPQSLRDSSPKGELNSLSQNLTVLTAPSEREPLAWRQGFWLKRKVCLPGSYPFRQSLRLCHLPQGDGFSGGGKLCGNAERRPPGGAGERSETEGVLPASILVLPRSAALSRKAARQLPFPSTTPPVKMQCRSVRRRSGIALLKIIFPLNMARAQAEAIQNRPTRKRQICPPPFLCPQSVVY